MKDATLRNVTLFLWRTKAVKVGVKEPLQLTKTAAGFNPVCELCALGVCAFVCFSCSQNDVNDDVLIFRLGKWPHIGLCAQRDRKRREKKAIKGRSEL